MYPILTINAGPENAMNLARLFLLMSIFMPKIKSSQKLFEIELTVFIKVSLGYLI